MKEETAEADQEEAEEGDGKDCVMAFAQRAADAFECEEDEEEVGGGVNDLGAVGGEVVVVLAPTFGGQ